MSTFEKYEHYETRGDKAGHRFHGNQFGQGGKSGPPQMHTGAGEKFKKDVAKTAALDVKKEKSSLVKYYTLRDVPSHIGAIKGGLPSQMTNRNRVLNAQRKVRMLHLKVLRGGIPTKTEAAVRRNAQHILDKWNNERKI